MNAEQRNAILKYLIAHEERGSLNGIDIANEIGAQVKYVMMLIKHLESKGYIEYIGMAEYYFQVSITLDGLEFYNSGGFHESGKIHNATLQTKQQMTDTQDKPYVFIGSSTEGLETAKAIQASLTHVCEPHIWSQGIFGLSSGTLETLVFNLTKFDFAIFVLTDDDITISREKEYSSPRDNVLLELGMFIGSIGKERTFMVVDKSARIKLPSDLAGITPAFFSPPNKGTMQSAVGSACYEIELAFKKYGVKALPQLNNSADFEIDKKLITEYLMANGYSVISYARLLDMNPSYTKEYILLLLRAFPDHFRLAVVKGKSGIALRRFIIPEF